ncbi:macrophage-stimulating protein receptor precursor [Anopheles sinensis]|uniref:Macrophage-stimulating protein receptor n=1 Tax=Anopheles sinensis TaxID=74873 RepID=A0A084WHH2_ANOSI|nr:macrophage-stimulating protein receptor precursor [Anopheles sinensis]
MYEALYNITTNEPNGMALAATAACCWYSCSAFVPESCNGCVLRWLGVGDCNPVPIVCHAARVDLVYAPSHSARSSSVVVGRRVMVVRRGCIFNATIIYEPHKGKR